MAIAPKEERKFRTLMKRIALDCSSQEERPPEGILEFLAWLEDPAGVGHVELGAYLDMLQKHINNPIKIRRNGRLEHYRGDPSPEEFDPLLKDPMKMGERVVRRVLRGAPHSIAYVNELYGIDTERIHEGMPAEEIKRIGDIAIPRAINRLKEVALREREFEARWPELYRYCHRYDTMTDREMEELERDAADRFSTALLKHKMLPREGGSLIAWYLCKWAYIVAAFDKVDALYERGKLFSDDFPPLVTMGDKPSFDTEGKWTEKTVRDMNEWLLFGLAQEAADEAIAYATSISTEEPGIPDLEQYCTSHGLGEQGLMKIKVSNIVAATREIQQEGMINGVRLLKRYLKNMANENPDSDPHENVIRILQDDWSEYFTDPASKSKAPADHGN